MFTTDNVTIGMEWRFGPRWRAGMDVAEIAAHSRFRY